MMLMTSSSSTSHTHRLVLRRARNRLQSHTLLSWAAKPFGCADILQVSDDAPTLFLPPHLCMRIVDKCIRDRFTITQREIVAILSS